MALYEIKNRFTGNIIFSIEADNLKLVVEIAIKSGANLSGADLSGANLSGADLSGADLSGADLSSADLSKANLSGADLSKADLSKADLSEANLSVANLSGADLSWADLSWADLSVADLSEANLSVADLSVANLSWADLSEADLSVADLRHIKHDMWGILLHALPEIEGLKQAIIDGKIDGSMYEGECACLCGTIAKIRNINYKKLGTIVNSSSLAERFFLAIRKGDTPETNQVSKLALEWINEFQELIKNK